MASILPLKPLDRIVFLEGRMAGWATNSVGIGTTSVAVTALTTKVSAARALATAQATAQGAAKSATQAFHAGVNAMTKGATDIIKQVKAKAATDGDGVYTLAVLPTPTIPGPVPAPGTPTDFKVALRYDGALIITWKCPNPRGGGTVYQVARQIGTAGELGVIGATGSRKFIDTALPAGAATTAEGGVTYQITAIRSTLGGSPGGFVVKFGVGGAGSGGVSIVQSAPRIAA